MITEIILVLFVIVYYLFSIFLFVTVILNINKKYSSLQVLGMEIITLVIAPIAAPIILGNIIGKYIKEH